MAILLVSSTKILLLLGIKRTDVKTRAIKVVKNLDVALSPSLLLLMMCPWISIIVFQEKQSTKLILQFSEPDKFCSLRAR